MLYRIRYNTDGSPNGAEVAVEANSPNEAIVKFRYMCSGQHRFRGCDDNVTSVSIEPDSQELA